MLLNIVRARAENNLQKYAPSRVIFKWVQRCASRPNDYYGLGDIVRGMLSVYQYCKKYRITLLVDIHEHPLSAFIEIDPKYNTVMSAPATYYETIWGIPLPKGDCVMFSNAYPQNITSDEERVFLKDIIRVKDEYRIQLPTNYNVFHIRTGDPSIEITHIPPEFHTYLSYITRLCKPGDVLCSDSSTFKQFVKDKLPALIVFNENVKGTHIGIETSEHILRSTLEDYQIIMGASKIYTYSIYPWISGFVHWCSNAHGIPLVDLKHVR